jgi:hypothetical protein
MRHLSHHLHCILCVCVCLCVYVCMRVSEKVNILNWDYLRVLFVGCNIDDFHGNFDFYMSLFHHHYRPSWVRPFDLFLHRHVAIFSWGVHDLFSLEVCSWGRVSKDWCCIFFQDDWSSFVCIWISRLVLQRYLVIFLLLRFFFCLVLCIF